MKLLRIMLAVFVAAFLVEAQDRRFRPASRTRNPGQTRQPTGRNQRKWDNSHVTHISADGFKTAIKRTIQKINAWKQLQEMLIQANNF